MEDSVEASSSTSAEASKELLSLPRASVFGSTYFYLRPRRPILSTGFHALPRTSPILHAILLSSITKEKQIEVCTEGNWRLPPNEANWRFQRKEVEAAGTSIASAPEASNEPYWLPLVAYMRSCICVRVLPQTPTKYVVL